MKITGLTKVNYKAKDGTEHVGISMKDYYAAKAKDIGAPGEKGEEMVKIAVNLAFKEGFELPEELSSKAKANIQKLSGIVKKDLEESETKRAAAKAAKEKEAAAAAALAEKRKASASAALVKASSAVASKVESAITKTVDDAAAKYLGKGFKVVNGNLEVTSEKLSEDDFAKGFAGLKALLDSTEAVGKGFAKLEAQMAIFAEKQYGSDWPNFFTSDPARVPTIKKNMAVLKLSSELGVELTTKAGDIPVGVARALLEANVSKGEKDSDKKNKEFKKEVLEKFIEESNEKGRVLTANEARNLVNEQKNKLKGDEGAKIQYNTLYVFSLPKIGTKFIPSKDKKPDPAWLGKAAFAVDRALNVMRMVKGELTVTPAVIPAESELAEILEILGLTPEAPEPKEEKKEKKGKGKPKKEEEKLDLEEDEEPTEEPEVDSGDDEASGDDDELGLEDEDADGDDSSGDDDEDSIDLD